MSLLDAPDYDPSRDILIRKIVTLTAGFLVLLLVTFWAAAGRPVDWPWHWNAHLRGRMAINDFFKDVEKNDMPAAYAVWVHDKNWQQHADKFDYPYDRFYKDWRPGSPDNEYGVISSHRIVAARMYGNVLLTATLLNGRKSKPVSLEYSPDDHMLNFAPEDVQLYIGPQ